MTTEIRLPVNALARMEGATCAGIVTRNRRKLAAFRMDGCTVYIPVRQKGARKAGTPKRDTVLYDTRTAAELWLAGETTKRRDSAVRRAEKAEYRSILVRFTNGFEVRTGSFLVDDGAAKADAIRFARARAMEARFEADHETEMARCRTVVAEMRERGEFSPVDFVEPHPFVWAPTGHRTRVCETTEVESVEFVPAFTAPAAGSHTSGSHRLNAAA